MKVLNFFRNNGYSRTLVSIVSYILVMFLPAGCIDEIELKNTENGEGKTVIQGHLIKGCLSQISVQVSRSLDFQSRELPPPLSGATVLLQDNLGNDILIPEVEAGSYQLVFDEDNPDFPVETENQYKITVTLSEGELYESTFEPLNPVPEPDSVSVQLVRREELDVNSTPLSKNYMQFFIHTSLLPENHSSRALLRWSFKTIYQVTEIFIPGPGPGPQTCYISRDLGLEKVVAFNGGESNTDRLDRFMIVEDLAESQFGLGYLMRVKQQSLSRTAYEYLNEVNQAVSLSGGLFEAAPGKILGNISNIQNPGEEVFGYFYASEETEITRFVKPAEAGNPEDFCGETQNASEEVCTNCTLIPFSTKEIPEGWEF